MKYVISDSVNKPMVVIGGDGTFHADLQKGFGVGMVASAGHFCIVNGRVHTYGKSIGLHIGRKPGDVELLEAELGLDDRNRLTEIPHYAKN